jgi:hypothetical protein
MAAVAASHFCNISYYQNLYPINNWNNPFLKLVVSGLKGSG